MVGGSSWSSKSNLFSLVLQGSLGAFLDTLIIPSEAPKLESVLQSARCVVERLQAGISQRLELGLVAGAEDPSGLSASGPGSVIDGQRTEGQGQGQKAGWFTGRPAGRGRTGSITGGQAEQDSLESHERRGQSGKAECEPEA